MYKCCKIVVTGLVLAVTVGCAHSPPDDPWDPLEPVNRKVYKFNDTFDRYAARPVAKAYRDYTPSPVRRGVGNFFGNARYPITVANHYLQGDFHDGTADLTRFVVNTLFGFVGLVDVASSMGLPEHDEDFGQTLGAYGVGQGAYIVLPFLGPSTGRDAIGRGVDQFVDPLNLVDDTATSLALRAAYLVDVRASLLGFDRSVRTAFDPYSFVRTAYLEDRLKEVHDGEPPRGAVDEP